MQTERLVRHASDVMGPAEFSLRRDLQTKFVYRQEVRVWFRQKPVRICPSTDYHDRILLLNLDEMALFHWNLIAL
jgi:hypothetical protein